MKQSEIKLGKRYAIEHDGDVVPADLVRPQGDEWIVVRALDPENYETPSARTERIPSRWIVAPWDDYCEAQLREASGWSGEAIDTGIAEAE